MRKKIKPRKGQESVWDYPRPPKLERTTKSLKVILEGMTLAETDAGYRVLETSHPPGYYFPSASIDFQLLKAIENKHSFCEFKGAANYWGTRTANTVLAWSYPKPNLTFLPIKDYLAFYPSQVEACFVEGERVQSQEGDFYGGWITPDIVGPFKGGVGTWGW